MAEGSGKWYYKQREKWEGRLLGSGRPKTQGRGGIKVCWEKHTEIQRTVYFCDDVPYLSFLPHHPLLHLLLSSSPQRVPYLPSPPLSLPVCLPRLISSLFTSTGLELIPSLNIPLSSRSTPPFLFVWCHRPLYLYSSLPVLFVYSPLKVKGSQHRSGGQR